MAPTRGEIWIARLDPIEGSEQSGTRPVVVVSNDLVNTLLSTHSVVPVISRRPKRKIYPSEVGLAAGTGSLRVDSVVLCHQVRTLSRGRLARQIGVLDASTVDEIDTALRVHLAL